MSDVIWQTRLTTPVGELQLKSNGRAIVELLLPGGKRPLQRSASDDEPLLREAVRQLKAYFAGKLTAFDLPLAPEGTAFQRRVWRALCDIPFGTTVSYGELARRIGQPTACRAVGAANGRNPIAIVIPCHRVIGSDKSLTGYGGGLKTKSWLLEHEASVDSVARLPIERAVVGT